VLYSAYSIGATTVVHRYCSVPTFTQPLIRRGMVKRHLCSNEVSMVDDRTSCI